MIFKGERARSSQHRSRPLPSPDRRRPRLPPAGGPAFQARRDARRRR